MSDARYVLTIMAVSDLARARDFYTAVFGWACLVDTAVYAELDAGGHRLGLYQRDGFAKNTGEPPALAQPGETSATEIYLYVNELEHTLAKLERSGARLLSPPCERAWGDTAAYWADPDGNVVVVAVPAGRD